MVKETARPARPIYHCTICNRPLPWDGGRIRLVCGKPDCHGELPRPMPIKVREGDAEDREALLAACRRFFGSEHLHAYGKVFSLEEHAFLVVEFDGEKAGYLSYELDFPCEKEATVLLQIVRPQFQGRGVGKALQGALEAVSRPKGIRRLHVSTSNDNIPGLYFYQRLGYRIEGITPDAAEAAIAAHGEPGMRGFGGIPIRDEIQLVKEIPRVVESD
jgi:ribosomal protein S18 acetylase RimI-like enzyme